MIRFCSCTTLSCGYDENNTTSVLSMILSLTLQLDRISQTSILIADALVLDSRHESSSSLRSAATTIN